jgi:acetyl-CoA carboxylase, biotin carboxylase subunit
MKPIRKILIANRGEIAVRILRTCREMNIETVAVYSEADRKSLHVRFASEAYLLGASAPAESYLRADRLIEIALQSGADAIHPGFGFLSENADFVQAVEQAGLIFIGPPTGAMNVMGDKLASRRAMIAAAVPVVPGTTEPAIDVAAACAAGSEIGYPVMLKASAGGGGKGIRIVDRVEDMEDAFLTASGEAQNAFGDGRMYVEKYIQAPRHIEVQILADRCGNTLAIGDRECSIQRRHQKLIEESPAYGIPQGIRDRMAEAAVNAARAVGYFSAGTVEFLYTADQQFYFLEMNTRLQVEHPVTEEVFGVDLVAQMIKIAAGEELQLGQRLQARGHSIEVRINAEDPEQNFMPSLGRVQNVRLPSGPGVRVDAAVYSGMEITPYYDAMIGKLISRGANREQARRRMLRMLQEFHLGGIATTAGFAMQLLQSEEFCAGRYDTGFLERFQQRETGSARAIPDDLEQVAAVLAVLHRLHLGAAPLRREQNQKGLSPWVQSHRSAQLGRGGRR